MLLLTVTHSKWMRWTPWLPRLLVRLPVYRMAHPRATASNPRRGSWVFFPWAGKVMLVHGAMRGALEYGQDSTPGVLDPKPLLFHSIALDLNKSIPWELGCVSYHGCPGPSKSSWFSLSSLLNTVYLIKEWVAGKTCSKIHHGFSEWWWQWYV